jgi:UDPglucose--hexose-1-phosphate uridylyltransferase
MPEIRQNMATKEWVIIATERARRPDDYIDPDDRHLTTASLPVYDPTCPFCPGNEEMELEIERWPQSSPWQTRVITNKFPALSRVGALSRSLDGLHRCVSGVGYHEVIVEHPHHNACLALMSAIEIVQVVETYYSRGWSIRQDSRVEQILFFKNHGEGAGASIRHPHSQIIALPVVPTDIRHRIEEAQRYFDDNGQCVYCTMLQEELHNHTRIVTSNDYFVAFVLYAAPSPFHLWVLPRQHNMSFLYTQPEERAALAQILKDVLGRLFVGLRDPSYNFIIRTAPAKEVNRDYLHWYITIIPRVNRPAGFELGAGMFINPALPEESAAFLREVNI